MTRFEQVIRDRIGKKSKIPYPEIEQELQSRGFRQVSISHGFEGSIVEGWKNGRKYEVQSKTAVDAAASVAALAAGQTEPDSEIPYDELLGHYHQLLEELLRQKLLPETTRRHLSRLNRHQKCFHSTPR